MFIVHNRFWRIGGRTGGLAYLPSQVGRNVDEMNVLALIRGSYWIAAYTALFGSRVELTTIDWLPEWGVWGLATLLGALYGLIIADSLARVHGIQEKYANAPVNGATGVRISAAEVTVPYLMSAVCMAIFLEAVNHRRTQHALPPLLTPHWVVYTPIGIGILVLSALAWSFVRYSRR
jgi:hypothetical protein